MQLKSAIQYGHKVNKTFRGLKPKMNYDMDKKKNRKWPWTFTRASAE
jgi:hypothetical protein